MADINMPQKTGKRKVPAPRIDLTPMVDLGFLLITFFIFTTTMAQPRTMEVNMPFRPATEEPTEVPEEGTIVLIPTAGHELVYYKGTFNKENDISTIKLSGTGNVREVLMEAQKHATALPPTFSKDAHKLHVIIKPASECTYADVVNLLDEMNILQIPYYAIDEITTEEKEWINN